MNKIFTITCTTCQARLAVRSEAVIGAILECPRCQSMVQATPPPGWRPTPPAQMLLPASGETGMPAGPSGPPPLDRVATVPLTLELEPARASLFGVLLRQTWLLWGGVPLATLAAILALLWVLFSRPEPESVAIDVERPAATVEKPAVKRHEDPPRPQSRSVKQVEQQKAKRPATVVEKPVAKPYEASPGSQSPGVEQVEQEEKHPATAAEDKQATAQEEVIEVKKAPPVQVDVAARLADPVADLELTDMPLLNAVELLAAMGALSVTMDADAMAQLGVTPRDLVSLRVSSTTVGKALQAVVAQKGLAVTAENGQVFIGAPAKYRETLQKVRYSVADLTGDNKAAASELAALMRKLIAPESWQGAGGRGTIEADRGAMVVVQTGEIHHEVLVFCEKLRNARNKPLHSRDNPERFALATRWDHARKMLEQPVTVNYHEPAPLVKILAFLAGAAGSDILVDRAALAAAETSDRVEATITASKQPLGEAMRELLRPLGLTYRAVGAHAIQVTTKEAAEERLEWEFYPVGPLLATTPLAGGRLGVRGVALAERLKARVAASTWSDVGGPCEVYFDPPSQCLIVLQSQAAQVAIERRLATKGEGGGGRAD